MALANVALTPGTGPEAARFDDTTQIVKQSYGAEGVHTLMDEKPATDAKLQTIVASLASLVGLQVLDYQPGYHDAGGTGSQTVDPDLQTRVRGPVLTDEGSYRINYAGSSLALAIPDATFVNGSDQVTTALDFGDATDLHVGDYIKLDADSEAAWAQVDRIEPQTIYLADNYSGAGGTGGASRQMVKTVTGSGASFTVTNGTLQMALGTTNGAITEAERDVDYPPLSRQVGVTVSNRVANQDIYVGMYDEAVAPPRFFAWFHYNGTTNTTVKCETAFNASTAPSAAETEVTTVTIPNGKTSAVQLRLRIEVLNFRTRFYIDGILVAEHFKSMPRPQDVLTSTVRCVNGTSPGGSTTVTLDYDAVRNFNFIDTEFPSETESVIAAAAPLEPFVYGPQAGIITINTDLLVIDCRQFRSLMIQCTSMGTTGVVTVQWADEPTFAAPITATLFSESGASSTTFNAAVLRYTNVIARYVRFRLTTATTAGTTTLYVHGSQNTMQQWLATQPVSGTVTSAGAAAHDAAISGNPTRIAGRALTANYATVATGDTADLITTLQGALIVKDNQIPELEFNVHDRITASSTTAIQVKAATASLKNFVTALSLATDTLGAAGDIMLRSTPVASTTATIASNTLVMAATYGWKVGDLVLVTASTVTGLSAGSYYYLLTVSGANLTFSTTRGGSTAAISGTSVSATLSKVIWRTKLQTASLPLTPVPLGAHDSGGTGLAIEMVLPSSLTSGQIDFAVQGYVAP